MHGFDESARHTQLGELVEGAPTESIVLLGQDDFASFVLRAKHDHSHRLAMATRRIGIDRPRSNTHAEATLLEHFAFGGSKRIFVGFDSSRDPLPETCARHLGGRALHRQHVIITEHQDSHRNPLFRVFSHRRTLLST